MPELDDKRALLRGTWWRTPEQDTADETVYRKEGVPLRTQPSRTVFMKQSSPWQLAQFCLSAALPMCTATSPLRYGFSASQARWCVAIGFCIAGATRRLIQ